MKRIALMRRFEGDTADWAKGQICFQRIRGFFYGYVMACPRCGQHVYLDLDGREDWVEGDIEDVEALTLKPRVWHDAPGCGWMGRIAGGVAEEM